MKGRGNKENIIQKKSFEFALKVIDVYKKVVNKKEFVLSKQFLKSGTSVGANIEEAIGAQTKKDFITKIRISYKEARETRYWIKLMFHSGVISNFTTKELLEKIEEICRILGKIISTTEKKIN